MSYCRFENTLIDLRDCYNALDKEGLDNLSKTEKKYALKLIELCKYIFEDFENIDEDDESDEEEQDEFEDEQDFEDEDENDNTLLIL